MDLLDESRYRPFRTLRARSAPVDVSIVVPLYNEEANIDELHAEIIDVLSGDSRLHELIYVVDGCSDGTAERLRRASRGDPRVLIVELARRFGQTAALACGFRCARGRLIVPMDGDLQHDPRDIPRLVEKLESSSVHDVVSGWRRNRKDRLFTRRLPSKIANFIIRRLTRTPEVHDFGCTLKSYRREVLEGIELHGELHRFLPAICKWQGARITEIEVNHRHRRRGRSKYGLRRTFKVLLDLITVKFLGDYLTKPIYFFGKAAFCTLAASLASLGLAVAQKLGFLTRVPVPLNRNVLVLFSMMLFLMAFLLVMMGVLSELLVRIYHQMDRGSYPKVRRMTRGDEVEDTPPRDVLGE